MIRNRAGEVIEEDKTLEPVKDFIDGQIGMSQVGGDLGTLAYLQALQNMNLMTQSLMKQSILGNNSGGVNAGDIKDIVRTIVMELMKELGAEVK